MDSNSPERARRATLWWVFIRVEAPSQTAEELVATGEAAELNDAQRGVADVLGVAVEIVGLLANTATVVMAIGSFEKLLRRTTELASRNEDSDSGKVKVRVMITERHGTTASDVVAEGPLEQAEEWIPQAVRAIRGER
jgi:hypothetical protein